MLFRQREGAHIPDASPPSCRTDSRSASSQPAPPRPRQDNATPVESPRGQSASATRWPPTWLGQARCLAAGKANARPPDISRHVRRAGVGSWRLRGGLLVLGVRTGQARHRGRVRWTMRAIRVAVGWTRLRPAALWRGVLAVGLIATQRTERTTLRHRERHLHFPLDPVSAAHPIPYQALAAGPVRPPALSSGCPTALGVKHPPGGTVPKLIPKVNSLPSRVHSFVALNRQSSDITTISDDWASPRAVFRLRDYFTPHLARFSKIMDTSAH